MCKKLVEEMEQNYQIKKKKLDDVLIQIDCTDLELQFRSGKPILQTLLVQILPDLKFKSSASACKWIDIHKYSNPQEIIPKLKDQGHQVYSLVLDEYAKTIYDVDWTKPSTIIIGNDHRCVSSRVQKISTQNLYIPMKGIIESLNVSVATAVTLYEAFRQREISQKYPNKNIDSKWLEKKLSNWIINRNES